MIKSGLENLIGNTPIIKLKSIKDSKSNIEQLKLYGANVILSNHKIGNSSNIIKARKIKHKNEKYIYLDQLSNKANVKTHYFNTGGEIVNEFSKVDYFLTGIGSGGTISGVGRRLKEEFGTKVIAVMPRGYDIKNNKYISHKIQGIGIGLIPQNLDLSIVDDFIYVDYDEIMQIVPDIMSIEGIFVGISSLANIVAAKKLCKIIPKDKIVVTIAQDKGDSYIENFTKDYYEYKNNK